MLEAARLKAEGLGPAAEAKLRLHSASPPLAKQKQSAAFIPLGQKKALIDNVYTHDSRCLSRSGDGAVAAHCEFRNALARPAAAAFNSYIGNGGPKP